MTLRQLKEKLLKTKKFKKGDMVGKSGHVIINV